MKNITIIICIFFWGISFSQNSKIKNILNQKGDVELPTSILKLNSALGVNPNIEEDDIHGNQYNWKLLNGITLSATPENSNIRWLVIKATGNQNIEGMPYGLILNQSTLKNSKTQFGIYSPKQIQLYENGNPNGYWLKFKKGNKFIYLTFRNSLLKEIMVSLFEIDEAS